MCGPEGRLSGLSGAFRSQFVTMTAAALEAMKVSCEWGGRFSHAAGLRVIVSDFEVWDRHEGS